MQSMASNLEFKFNVNLRLVKPDFMQSTAVNLKFKLKVIFKLLSCNRPIWYCKQQRTNEFRIRLIKDERENIFNCTRLRFEQHKHEEKTISLKICISSFVHCYCKQKSLRIVEKKKTVQR